MSSRPEHGIVIAKDVMVPMRDGVRLATDVYRVGRDGELVAGQFPTILGRTSYDKTSPQQWVDPVANFFVPRGYVVVLQDLFLFDFGMGVDESGKFLGHLKSTGIRPKFGERLADNGIRLGPEIFAQEPFARRMNGAR